MNQQLQFDHDNYFVIRRPLLSVDALDELLAKHALLNPRDSAAVVKELIGRPEIAHAVRLSTPGFFERLSNPSTADRAPAQLAALMRYVVRMSTRSTPFAGFSSVGMGALGPDAQTRLDTATVCLLEIDCGLLAGIDARIRQQLAISMSCRVRRTPISYEMAGTVRFVERKVKGAGYAFELAKLARTEYLDLVLKRLSEPARVDALVAALLEFDADIAQADALEFISALCASGVLEIDADLQLIGGRCLERYLERLTDAVPESRLLKEYATLSHVLSLLHGGAPCTGEQAVARVDAVEQYLEQQGHKVVRGKTVHVDTFSTDAGLALSDSLVEELGEAVAKLHELFPIAKIPSLEKFDQSFEQRFGEQFIPLSAALDPETGINFGFSAPLTPWVSALAIGARPRSRNTTDTLLRANLWNSLQLGKPVIDLADIASGAAAGAARFPNSFSACITLFDTVDSEGAEPRGPSMSINFLSAPGATNVMARFAARYEPLAQAVTRTALREDRNYPEIIYAEIIHSPAPRAANVMTRPSARPYEIVLSGTPSVPHSHQLTVDDLYVGLVDNTVVLWSRRLDRRVIPRLSSAHNYSDDTNLGLYQFFCSLAQQDALVSSFRWPQSVADLPFLPRVVYKSVVVARARWRVAKATILEITRHIDAADWDAVGKTFSTLGVPRWFAVEVGDNRLEIDRHSRLSLLMLADELANRPTATFVEAPARTGKPLFRRSAERWHAEIVVPLHVRAPSAGTRLGQLKNVLAGGAAALPAREDERAERWEYLRIYGGEDYLDTLLIEELGPVLRKATADGTLSAWFYVRYRDPDFHLRLRFKGRPQTAKPFLNWLTEALLRPKQQEHELAGFCIDTYLPEYRRYGGPRLLPLVEQVFHHDSRYCLSIRKGAAEEGNDEILWKGALSGTLAYLGALGMNADETAQFVKLQRDSFASEMHLGKYQHDQMGVLYRRHRQYVEGAVVAATTGSSAIRAPLDERRAATAELLERIFAELEAARAKPLLGSLIHMQCNRIFSGNSRPQEFVMWDFLQRAFRSVAAKNRWRHEHSAP